MKNDEARVLKDDQLQAEIGDLRRKLYSLRCQTVTEKVEDNSQFHKIRRDIARLLTIQGERRGGSEAKTKAPTKTKAPAKKGRKN